MGNTCCNSAGNQETLDIKTSPDAKKGPSEGASELVSATALPDDVKADVTPQQEAAPVVAKPIEKPADAKPAEPEKPTEAEKPAEPEKPTEAEKPVLPKQWDISVPTKGAKLGVDLGTNNNKAAYMTVNMVKDGLLKTFNTNNPEQAVQQGDRIVKLNGATNVADMLTKVKGADESQSMELSLLRPNTWEVAVPSTGGLGVEMSTPSAAQLYLQINEVKPGQAITVFNGANPTKAVKAGDRIASCNGVSEDAQQIFNALGQARESGKECVMLIERP